jgi:SAM-dependent methyltransferase
MQLFSQQVRPASSAVLYLTEQATPLFHWLKDRYPLLIGSESLSDSVPLGTEKDGLRNEDLTALTFDNDAFDHILSFDVLEHVNDDMAAFKEIHRCLKPGGTFLFSVPFSPERADKQVRARILPDGSIEHLLPTEYHGNPVDHENGALCFRNFAWDLIHDLKQVGFEDPRVLSYWSRDFAYLGVEQFMFIAKKGPGKN